jgi:hypothetical protein
MTLFFPAALHLLSLQAPVKHHSVARKGFYYGQPFFIFIYSDIICPVCLPVHEDHQQAIS